MSESSISTPVYFVASIVVTVVVTKITETGLSYLGKCMNEEGLMHLLHTMEKGLSYLGQYMKLEKLKSVLYMICYFLSLISYIPSSLGQYMKLEKLKSVLYMICYFLSLISYIPSSLGQYMNLEIKLKSVLYMIYYFLSLISYIPFFFFGVYLGLKYRIGISFLFIILTVSGVWSNFVLERADDLYYYRDNWMSLRVKMLLDILVLLVAALFVALLSRLWTLWTISNLCLSLLILVFLIILVALEVQLGSINDGIKLELAGDNILFSLTLMLVVALFVASLSYLWGLFPGWSLCLFLIIWITLEVRRERYNRSIKYWPINRYRKWGQTMIHISFAIVSTLVVTLILSYIWT